MIRTFHAKIFQHFSDMPLICLYCDPHSVTRFSILPLFSRSSCSLMTCFLISCFLHFILMRSSTAGRFHPIVRSSPCTVATTCSFLFRPCHTTRARNPSRQLELAERRRELLLPVLRGVARAVQALSPQSAHVFIGCLVVLWRQLDEHSPTRWCVEIRPSHADECHNFPFTIACGDF